MPENDISIQTAVQPMRRPLLGLAFFYLAGTWAGAWIVGFHFKIGLALALLALVVASGLCWADKLRRWKAGAAWQSQGSKIFPPFLSGFANGLIYLAVFLAGWLAISLRINDPSERDIASLMDRPREGVEIIGMVADDPALRKSRDGEYFFWSFTLRIEAVSRIGFFQKARGEILVTMPQDKNGMRPAYGERWRLTGALIDKAASQAGGPRSGLIQDMIPYRFSFQADPLSGEQIRLNAASPFSFLRGCFLLRQKCADILARGIEHKPEVVAVLQALVLGRQHELPFAMREAFVATGTYHIFAISGQHVAIIAVFVIVVLQAYGICRLHWFYYLAPVLIVFTIMTGLSASAVRGCLMALMCFLGPLFKRKTDISSAMALAALAIVGAAPRQLFQAGFLLSFGIVAGLIVLCPPLIAAIERRNAPDPYQLAPENIFLRSARKAGRWFAFMVVASLAAWLVSTPLMARWFNLISPVALPANLLIIPMAALVLLVGCLAIVFGLFCPFAAEAFNFTGVFLVSLMTGLTEVLARVPFGHIFVKAPPLWFVLLWFLALIVWRVYYQKRKVWLSAFLILVVAVASAWVVQRKEWEINIVNVDGGAVCLADSGMGLVLINTGPEYQTRNVLNYLRRQGVNRLRALILTRPDPEHNGGAKDIIGALPVKEIILDWTKPESNIRKELLLLAEKRKINVRKMKMGEQDLSFADFEDFSIHFSKDAAGPACPSSAREVLALPMAIRIIGRATVPRNAGQASLFTTPEAWPRRLDSSQPGFEIVVEEENSSLDRMKSFVASTQAVYRVVCHPLTEERKSAPRVFLEDFSAETRIVLGAGQGMCITPDRQGVKIDATGLSR